MLQQELRLNHSENVDRYPCKGATCTDIRGRLFVRQTNKGELWHCHNCGSSGFIRAKDLSPNELLNRFNNLSVIPSTSTCAKSVKLPYDFSTKIPNLGLQWFYKYGIFEDVIKKYSFGFSEKYNRIVMPVFDDGELVYYQSRTLDTPTKSNPKYINVRQSGAKSVFFKSFAYKDSDKLVVVEDILSACKVGLVTNAVSLLGSYIPDSFVNVCKDFDKIYIWLDRDKLREALKYANRLRYLLNKQVIVICKPLDPKEYSIEVIREILE